MPGQHFRPPLPVGPRPMLQQNMMQQQQHQQQLHQQQQIQENRTQMLLQQRQQQQVAGNQQGLPTAEVSQNICFSKYILNVHISRDSLSLEQRLEDQTCLSQEILMLTWA